MDSPRDLRRLLAALAFSALTLLVLAAPASAKSYTDVPKSHWARSYISSVTNRTAAGHRLLDDYGTVFKPERAITRALLARSIVLASGHYGERIKPVEIADVPKGYRHSTVIQLAVHEGYMGLDKAGNFRPTQKVTAAAAEMVVVRWLKEKYPAYDWSLLTSLAPSRWEPNPGWKTRAPAYLPYLVASRQLELRYNHSSTGDDHEALPKGPIDRAEVAYMIYRGYRLASDWQLYGLAGFKDVTFAPLSDRQKQIAKFALKYVGYPYVWAGEYPTPDSPYGAQKAGGFDCSGFVFYVMKMHFGYEGITVNQRGAHDMAAVAKPRITRDKLKCGDLIFFGPNGPASSVNSIYHAALYLGRGWFIHSTGSSDGVTLGSLNTSTYWKSAFAWGRRVLAASDLGPTPPSPSPSPSSVGRALRGSRAGRFAVAGRRGVRVAVTASALTGERLVSGREPWLSSTGRVAALVLLLLAGCAAALCAAAAFAAPAHAATAAHLTASPAPAAVVYPGSAVISGSLTGESGGLAGAALDLFARPAGAAEWSPAGSTSTRADGTFSFGVAPAVSTDYQVRYSLGVTLPAASADVRVAVQPRVGVSFPVGPVARRDRAAGRHGRSCAPRRHHRRHRAQGRGRLAAPPHHHAGRRLSLRAPVGAAGVRLLPAPRTRRRGRAARLRLVGFPARHRQPPQ